MSAANNKGKDKRFSMRMYGKDYDKLTYWSERFDMDRGELLMYAMDHYISYRNGDYDVSTAEQQRVNQLTDAVVTLIETVKSFEKDFDVTTSSLLNLAQGSNSLSKHRDDDGIL